MQLSALRALEFERIVEAVTTCALTPMGADRLARLILKVRYGFFQQPAQRPKL